MGEKSEKSEKSECHVMCTCRTQTRVLCKQLRASQMAHALLKRLLLRVHPDLLAARLPADKVKENDAALRTLQQLLQGGKRSRQVPIRFHAFVAGQDAATSIGARVCPRRPEPSLALLLGQAEGKMAAMGHAKDGDLPVGGEEDGAAGTAEGRDPRMRGAATRPAGFRDLLPQHLRVRRGVSEIASPPPAVVSPSDAGKTAAGRICERHGLWRLRGLDDDQGALRDALLLLMARLRKSDALRHLDVLLLAGDVVRVVLVHLAHGPAMAVTAPEDAHVDPGKVLEVEEALVAFLLSQDGQHLRREAAASVRAVRLAREAVADLWRGGDVDGLAVTVSDDVLGMALPGGEEEEDAGLCLLATNREADVLLHIGPMLERLAEWPPPHGGWTCSAPGEGKVIVETRDEWEAAGGETAVLREDGHVLALPIDLTQDELLSLRDDVATMRMQQM